MKEIIFTETVWRHGKKENECKENSYVSGIHTIKISSTLMQELLGRKFAVTFVSIPSEGDDKVELDVVEADDAKIS